MAKKEYTNDEVTVVWQPDLCIHSEKCFKGLPEVFNPGNRPWVNISGASTSKTVEQVTKCPSGALSYFMNETKAEMKEDKNDAIHDEQIVEVAQNGPLMVYGNITVKLASGKEEHKNRVTAFCRCGASGNKPFCDGSHKKVNFEG